mmetsp:Transcript_49774/g.115514  ORF Transcript_49774/g.115514 Transcript_49774/m.115514 type:complete len:225 (+) Transcript_49774:415-1089(+)
MRSSAQWEKTCFHKRTMVTRSSREPAENSSKLARMKAMSSAASGGSKSPSSSTTLRHCCSVLAHKSKVELRSSSAGLCPLPRWRLGGASPGSRFSASSSSCSLSMCAETPRYSASTSGKGLHKRVAEVTSRRARTAAALSVREPFSQKPLMSGRPVAASSVPSPRGGAFLSRLCTKAAMSARARTSIPVPSKTGKDRTAAHKACCRPVTAVSSDQSGRGLLLSS